MVFESRVLIQENPQSNPFADPFVKCVASFHDALAIAFVQVQIVCRYSLRAVGIEDSYFKTLYRMKYLQLCRLDTWPPHCIVGYTYVILFLF